MADFQSIVKIIYSAGLILSCCGVVAVLLQKPSYQQKIMTGLTAFIAVSWLGTRLGFNALSTGEMQMATKVIFTGNCQVLLFQLMLMFNYCHVKPPRVLYPLLGVVNISINAAALYIGQNDLFFCETALESYKGVNKLVMTPGPFYRLFVAMQMFYSVVVAITAVYAIVKSKGGFVAVGGVTVAVLFPTAASMLHFSGYFVIDWTPVGYLISEIIIFILIYGSKIYDVEDTARQYVFDSLKDGIIVLDRHQRIKGYNEVAQSIFPELKFSTPDMNIADASPDINKIFYDKADNDIEAGPKVYSPDIRKIYTGKRKGHLDGYVLWITDITEQRRNMELLGNYQRDLERDVKEKTARIVRMQEQMIYSFATLVESRDSATGEHVRRTSEYVAVLAAEMKHRGYYPLILTVKYLEYLRLAAPLHDIGKIKVPDSILKKPDKLEPEEFEIMKSHTVYGGQILEDTLKNIEGESFYDVAKDVAIYHHEKWNGSGYPYGTSREDIPLSARIMAVADFYDALTSARPYKKPYSSEKTFSILQEESGKSFDPKVVECFVICRKKVEDILVKYGGELTADTEMLSARDKQ